MNKKYIQPKSTFVKVESDQLMYGSRFGALDQSNPTTGLGDIAGEYQDDEELNFAKSNVWDE